MTQTNITVVRIYLTEADSVESTILTYLHDQLKVRGVTVFRGITGFGQSREMHDSKLLYMSLDLPIVIEFFDDSVKVTQALTHLTPLVGEGHMISWQATAH